MAKGEKKVVKKVPVGERLIELLLKSHGSWVSNEELAACLEATQLEIYNEINSLRTQGYPITETLGQGYCLAELPDLLTRPVMATLLSPRHLNHLVILDEVDSTNTYAHKIVLDGADQGTVVIANRQTNGTGRMGRSFESPAGQGVYLSMILKPGCKPQSLSLLTSFAGLAVCLAVEDVCSLSPSIKWPNDIILKGKKVCGILSKLITDKENNRGTYAVVGIGVNVSQECFGSELEDKAISLAMAGVCTTRPQIAAAIIHRMDEIFIQERWLNHPSSEKIALLRERSCTIGNRITIFSPFGLEEGEALDIAPDGGLVVRVGNIIKTLTSGEISVRGILGYL